MELSKKLQLPPESAVFVVDTPKGLKLDLKISKNQKGLPVLLFARNAADLMKNGKAAIDSAIVDGLSWIAYPKAGKLDTDLNRDKLVEFMRPHRIEGVRLVSIDETWSAMRFRPIRGD
jgi:hypothetical protein